MRGMVWRERERERERERLGLGLDEALSVKALY